MILGADGRSVSGVDLGANPMTEVTRSFSYKLNAGNYESRDFFASQKVHCKMSEAEDASLAAYQFCRAQVLESVRLYLADMNGQRKSAQKERAA